MNGMDARAFFDDLRETREKMIGRIYSPEEVEMISKGILVREKEEKEMTKTMEKMVGRIYEELAKWCEERNVIYEYNFSTDEGESCTFITPDTTLTVNHVENRDPKQFSKYVKNVLFGVDDTVDNLKKLVVGLNDKIDDLNKKIVIKNNYIMHLQCELKNAVDVKNRIVNKLNDEVREVNRLKVANDRLFSLCKNKAIYVLCDTKVDVNSMHPIIGADLNLSEVMKDVKERITKLENGTIYTNNMLTGICNRLDKLEKPSDIDLSLSEVKKDIKEKQELIDALNNLFESVDNLDERITWITDHMENAENAVARSIEKIGNDQEKIFHNELNIFTRLDKLEDAQPKESAKKTSKKTQKSTLS